MSDSTAVHARAVRAGLERSVPWKVPRAVLVVELDRAASVLNRAALEVLAGAFSVAPVSRDDHCCRHAIDIDSSSESVLA